MRARLCPSFTYTLQHPEVVEGDLAALLASRIALRKSRATIMMSSARSLAPSAGALRAQRRPLQARRTNRQVTGAAPKRVQVRACGIIALVDRNGAVAMVR